MSTTYAYAAPAREAYIAELEAKLAALLAERDRLAAIYDAILEHARATAHLTDQSRILAILNGDHA